MNWLRDYWIFAALEHGGLSPFILLRKRRISVIWMGRVERPNERFPLFTGFRNWGGMSWFFLSLWCYSGLFLGEGFLNISVCVNGCSCLVLSPSFTAVNTASFLKLSFSVCVCTHIFKSECMHQFSRVGAWQRVLNASSLLSFMSECWQMCWSVLSLTWKI